MAITNTYTVVFAPSAFSTQGRLLCTQHQSLITKKCKRFKLSPGSKLKKVSLPTHRNTGSRLIRTGSAKGFFIEQLGTGRHKIRSPRKQGRILHAIGERPENASTLYECFPPAPTPNWAFKASTRGFTDMPFKGFLGPSW